MINAMTPRAHARVLVTFVAGRRPSGAVPRL